ncbi:hypothetical protein AM493_06135 [Flavobacterium akiainvivens]|uniref:DUF4258 domain-containing protein n=1 Tax=Flavobacterium akiainvivens TaxID=1202724 RepID=A0A0M9VHT6_9FLAO|nr:DUF4258 domain-containing protein [Flavobacterium akiainvivens]KOS05659.1 hypothetical protein AM493_06135 [Flavobacterium akiainvivens]SFQ36172.1 hypothetical protein SAMN05444144_103263 [Flavobacterium akiainvivens]
MKFKHRLAYYLFGLCMGGFLVAMIFNKRGQEFCYLPNCRVLKNIRSKGITYSKEALGKIDQKIATKDDIKKSLQYGDVDFGKSNTPHKGGGKTYIIEGRNFNNEDIIINITNYEHKAVLEDITKP